MALQRAISQVLLDEVTTVQSSEWVDISNMTDATFYISATSIISGGTVKILAESPDGVEYPADTQVITTDDFQTIVTLAGAFGRVRAQITSRTDGTYTVSLMAKPQTA